MALLSDLDAPLLTHLVQQRDWVEGWIPPDNTHDFTNPATMLSLVKAIIASGKVGADETAKWHALGTYMGLAIAEAADWQVMQYSDETGTGLVIVFQEPDGFVFPATLLTARLEAGEDIDVFDLANRVIGAAEQLMGRGGDAPEPA